MEETTFRNIRIFVEQKSLMLMKLEKRSFANVGLDLSKHHELIVEDRHFVVIATNVFYHMLDTVLAEACEKYPQLFGNDNVNTVLKALYEVEQVNQFEHFNNFLKTEQFAWILEIVDEQVNPKVLRVELFRKIDNNRKDASKTEFTGGLFHAFRHFNYKGIPLSTKKEKNDLEHPSTIIDFLIKGFYFSNLEHADVKKCYSIARLNDKYDMRFDFYYEPDTEIYFVNSIRKQE